MSGLTNPANYLSYNSSALAGGTSLGSSGSMAIDPFFGSLVGAGASIFGGLMGQNAQADAIKSQVAGANFAAQLAQNQKSLEAAYGLMGPFLQEQFAPRQLERQKEARRFEVGDIGALQRAGRQEDMRRAASFATSGLGRDAARQAAKFEERLARAKARGAYSGLFGPIASDFT
ncbi:MAG: hypothetical protein ACO4AN_04815 [Candidatus Nanopelagicales bacterium]